ncbi:hypothetical protein [Allosphingosinicella deserti]|uniref:Uncharacterized protein n=1 Tax=Allosphingosinicella deserti TaxID=2116704 RepID=A0A2P7QVB8_9SPHN|nr:hypothetical protein [Sphingomonas deserti]PSJ41921.1 hypothetical protein C7I55_06565 [Sphingomonas deserti]
MGTAYIILTHTPLYVWVLLVLLLFLGARRLKERRTHLALAALAPASFFVWSVATAALLFFGGDKAAASIAWPLAFLGGALSGPIRTVPRPSHVHGWVFHYAATRLPLTVYLLLWSTRYGLGIWAGFVPAMAGTLGLVALALSAFTAGRTFADFLPLLLIALRAQKKGMFAN